mgnify:CR=1 FL=1
MEMKLGEILIGEGLLTPEQLQQALDEQKKNGGKIGQIFIDLGFVPEERILFFLQQQLGMIAVNLDEWEVDPEILKLIPGEVAKKHLVIPIEKLGDTLTVAMMDPTDRKILDDLKFITNLNIEPAISTKRSLTAAVDKYYKSAREHLEDKTKDLSETVMDVVSESDEMEEEAVAGVAADDKPLVKLVNQIILDGIRKKASDIHIEPYEKYTRLRYRMDGVLHTADKLPRQINAGLVSRIKIISHLNIAEKRVPQDGKARVTYDNRNIDLRVAIIPCVWGEKVVIRILDKGSGEVTLDMLGFEQAQLERFTKGIDSPWGMILITGPTGSGKTWTLSTSLKLKNTEDVNIMTAEDPVEFDIEGLNQVQAKPEVGLTFASALKSFLRADPDIVMIGEVRDFETGEIAVKAAQTGHLVFATLHTNSAPDTIARLGNMGIEPFNIASSLVMIIAQRLVRKVCSNCKIVDEDVTPETKMDLGIPKDKVSTTDFYKGKGCSKCNNTGYKGRTAVYEVLFVTEEMRSLIVKRASVDDIKALARKQGMKTLRESAVIKALKGTTTVEEIFRTTAADSN